MTAGATHPCTLRVKVPAAALLLGGFRAALPTFHKKSLAVKLAPPFDGGRALVSLSHQRHLTTVTVYLPFTSVVSLFTHLSSLIATFPVHSNYLLP